jgi:hypothetical protein
VSRFVGAAPKSFIVRAHAPVLDLAVGRLPRAALPGWLEMRRWQLTAIHSFAAMGELEPDDVIRISIPRTEYRFGVIFTDIVNHGETFVPQPSSGQSLRLITCYPLHSPNSCHAALSCSIGQVRSWKLASESLFKPEYGR